MSKISQQPTDNSPALTDVALGNATGPSTKITPWSALLSLFSSNWKNPYKFFAYRNASLTTSASTIIFENEVYDTHGDYDNTTGIFTAPVTGFYRFNAQIMLDYASAGKAIGVIFVKNSTQYINNSLVTTYNSVFNEAIGLQTPPIPMNAGDTMKVLSADQSSTAFAVGSSPINTWFSGELTSVT